MGSLQCLAIASFRPCHKSRNARDGRSARARGCSYFPVGFSRLDLLRHFKPLAPCLEFRESTNIAQQPRHFLFTFAGSEGLAEGLEPGVLAPVAFGEASFSHNGWRACTA